MITLSDAEKFDVIRQFVDAMIASSKRFTECDEFKLDALRLIAGITLNRRILIPCRTRLADFLVKNSELYWKLKPFIHPDYAEDIEQRF